MYCPDCGTQNEAGARFCANCGAELPVRAPRHAASHLDSNGDGIPDALEAPTTLVGAAAPTTVMPGAEPTTVMPGAEPTTVMAAPETELDKTRVAPRSYQPQAQRQYAPAPMPAPEPAPRKKGHKGLVAALLAVIVLVCAGIGVMSWRNYQAECEAAEQARQEQEAAKEAAEKEAAEKRLPHNVILPLSADGLDASGTRVPMYLAGTDFEGNSFEKTVYVDYRGMGISVPKGSYSVTVLASPIAADGTIYDIPSGSFAFDIPENQANGTDFSAPGSLVLSPYTGDNAQDVLDAAISAASEDPDMSAAVVNALAEAAQAKIDAASQAASDAEQQAAHEEAVREAEADGLVVLTGTVHIMTARELSTYQGVELEQIYGDMASDVENDAYVIVELDEATTFDAMSGDGMGLRPDEATMVWIQNQDLGRWASRDGQKITIGIKSAETWWPSDASLPLGEPRTRNVRVID